MFMIHPRCRLALNLLISLTKRPDLRPIPLIEMCQDMDISLSYGEQIIADLRNGGIVKSFRGPGGGYRLALPTDQIHVNLVARLTVPTPFTGDAIMEGLISLADATSATITLGHMIQEMDRLAAAVKAKRAA